MSTQYPHRQSAAVAGWTVPRPWFIYMAHSPRPALVKVGMTTDPQRRVTELGITSWHLDIRQSIDVLYPFSLLAVWPLGEVSQVVARSVESRVHRALKPYRAVSYLVEWYRVRPTEAWPRINEVIGARGTARKQEAA